MSSRDRVISGLLRRVNSLVNQDEEEEMDYMGEEDDSPVRGNDEVDIPLYVILSLPLPLAFLFVGLAGTLLALRANDVERAGAFGTFASGSATLILVSLTAFYSVQTSKQVNESKKSRLFRQRREKLEREREKRALRKALLNEIDQYMGFDQDAAELVINMRSVVPRGVYEKNSDKIGLLSEYEIEKIIKYYNTAGVIEELAHAHRADDEDNLEEVRKMMSLLVRARNEAEEELRSRLESEDDLSEVSGYEDT